MEPGTLCYTTSSIPTPDIGNYTYCGIFHKGKTLLCVTNFKNGMKDEKKFAPDVTFEELESNMIVPLILPREIRLRYTLKKMDIPKTQQLYIDLYSNKVQEELEAYQQNCDDQEENSCDQAETLKKFKEKYLSAEKNLSTKAQLKF